MNSLVEVPFLAKLDHYFKAFIHVWGYVWTIKVTYILSSLYTSQLPCWLLP